MKKLLSLILLTIIFTGVVISCEKASTTYTISEKWYGYYEEVGLISEIKYGQETVIMEIVPGVKLDDNQLKINDTTMDIFYLSIDSLQIIDNVIIFTTRGTGGGHFNTRLYAFDMDGKKLLEIYALDENGMYVLDTGNDDSFEIHDDGKIMIRGSRAGQGPSLRQGDGTDLELTDESNNWISSIPGDEVVQANYEIMYLGGGKFGEITKIETTMTYEQLKNMINLK